VGRFIGVRTVILLEYLLLTVGVAVGGWELAATYQPPRGCVECVGALFYLFFGFWALIALLVAAAGALVLATLWQRFRARKGRDVPAGVWGRIGAGTALAALGLVFPVVIELLLYDATWLVHLVR
jgi:hypothetical protein